MKNFQLKGKNYTGCIKNDISPSDVTRPCSLLMKELKFIKELDTKNKMKSSQGKYFKMHLNELESPVEIVIKVRLRL